jgi:sialic acid synthase
VIAEIGHNHQGSVEHAKQLFEEASRCGANSVKLQKRDNPTLYTREAFNRSYENENSYGPTYGLHREALEFGRAEYQELKAYAGELGITFFATAFDFKSAEMLADLDMPAYKIASADVVNLPLLRHVASFGKPTIMSTGGATMDDVRRGHDTFAEINPDVALLQCTAGYPAAWDELDLRVISTFREQFPETVIGLSSHDNGIAMAVAAHVLGARIVEKHFTLDRTMKGTDHKFSLEPQGLRKMCRDLSRLHVALGDGVKRMHPSEEGPITKMAKKLVAARDLPAGHVLTERVLALKSPGDGIGPGELE